MVGEVDSLLTEGPVDMSPAGVFLLVGVFVFALRGSLLAYIKSRINNAALLLASYCEKLANKQVEGSILFRGARKIGKGKKGNSAMRMRSNSQ